MENAHSIVPADSDLSLLYEEEKKAEADLQASHHLTWSSRYHCILAYICVSTSYVSSLRLCKSFGKYGFVIVIPYVIFNALVGVPAMLVEVMVGRYVMGSVIRAWNMCLPAKGVLCCLIGTTLLSIIHNNMCSIFLLKYFFSSFGDELEWTSCDNSWARINCYEIGKKANALVKCLNAYPEEFCRNLTWESSGRQFWKYGLEHSNTFTQAATSVLCLLASILVIILINYKGIRSMEKTLAVLVYCPIVLGIILVFVSFSLTEALFGLKKLWSFEWAVLLKLPIWLEGFEDTLCFLGLGKLSLSFVSSHGNFKDDIIVDVMVIGCSSFVSCILMIVPVLSVAISTKHLDDDEEIPRPYFTDIEDVFISLSEALLLYPFPNILWCILVYLNWFIVTSGVQAILVLAICELFASILHKVDKLYYFTTTFSICSFFLSIFLIFFRFEFKLNLGTVIITIVLLCTITWQLFYGIGRFNYDYFFMMGYPLPIFLKFTWITLLILPLAALPLKMYYEIPDKPLKYIVYIYAGAPIFTYICSLLAMILYYEPKISKIFTVNPDWGPDNPLLKKSRIIFNTGTVTREFMYRQELYKKPFMKPPDFFEQNIVQLI